MGDGCMTLPLFPRAISGRTILIPKLMWRRCAKDAVLVAEYKRVAGSRIVSRDDLVSVESNCCLLFVKEWKMGGQHYEIRCDEK